MIVHFLSAGANNASASLNVNGLGNRTIKKNFDTNLAANDIKNGQMVSVIYDGSSFQMLSQLGNAAGGSPAMGFTLSADRTRITCPANQNTFNSPIFISGALASGTPSFVTMSLSALPAGVTATFSHGGGVPPFRDELRFSVANGTASATHTITITATGGGTTQTLPITLRIGNRRVFITAATYQGNMGGPETADVNCTSEANGGLIALQGYSFQAFLGTVSGGPVGKLLPGGYERPDGTIVATSIPDLVDGTIAAAINRDQSNNTIATPEAWTGLQVTGHSFYGVSGSSYGSMCWNWSRGFVGGFASAESGATGNGNNTAINIISGLPFWMSVSSTNCDSFRRLFCFER
jgi:hypothetical protein